MKGVCRLCGCTEENPCVMENGLCAWLDDTKTLCTACVDVIPELHLIIPRMCRYCQHLRNNIGTNQWTCWKGRFGVPARGFRWFAWSGIWRARYKRLRKAQRHCPEFVACKNIDQIHEKGRPA